MNHFVSIYGANSLIELEGSLNYLKRLFPEFVFELRGEFFSYHLKPEILDHIAERLASIRVLNPMNEELNPEPIPGEIEYEKRKLINPSSSSIGVFYDGIRLQGVLYTLINKEERGFKHIHIVITNQLIVTWDESDRRYHLRVGVYGFPSIISLSGIVEAPAKPREFYIMKNMGVPLPELKKRFEGRFIDYGDMRLPDVLKGYLIQAIFYGITGEPFCSNSGCKLFNAHWQEEMIHAQLKSPYEFCEKHREFIR